MSTFQPLASGGIDLSNQNGQGTYNMTDPSGKTVQVPYSQVGSASKQGYNFTDSNTANQFDKDMGADPNASADAQNAVNQYRNNTGLGKAATGIVEAAAGDVLNPIKNAVTHPVATALNMTPIGQLSNSIKQAAPAFEAYEKARLIRCIGGATPLKAANDVAQQNDQLSQLFEANAQRSSRRTRRRRRLALSVMSLRSSAPPGQPVALLTLLPSALRMQVRLTLLLRLPMLRPLRIRPVHRVPAADATTSNPLANLANKGKDLFSQVTQGKNVAQAPTQTALRDAASTAADTTGTADADGVADSIQNDPLAANGETFLDDHISTLGSAKQAAYKQIDDAVGFNLKGLKQQVANDNDALGQPRQHRCRRNEAGQSDRGYQ